MQETCDDFSLLKLKVFQPDMVEVVIDENKKLKYLNCKETWCDYPNGNENWPFMYEMGLPQFKSSWDPYVNLKH